MTTKPPSNKEWRPPTKAQIAQAVASSGYPFEIACALDAEHANFEVVPNWTWFDQRTSKVREVDVVAAKQFSAKGVWIELHLLMECKRYRGGIVLFEWETELHTAYDWTHFDLANNHFWGQPASVISRHSDLNGTVAGAPFTHCFGWASSHWKPAGSPCFQLAVVKGDSKSCNLDQTEVHEALDGLTHGLFRYQREAGHFVAEYKEPFINLAVPLLVVEGPIYVRRPARPGQRATLRRTRDATVVRRLIDNGEHRVVRVDVVEQRHLKRYLATLSEDVVTLSRRLEHARDFLVRSIPVFGRHPPPPSSSAAQAE